MIKKISIIVPVYNEAKNIEELFNSINEVFKALPEYVMSLLFVDDGSNDSSWEVISALSQKDSRISGLLLSRNFGKEMALTAGIEALGPNDAVLCIDADLQHPPTLIPVFIEKWEKGADIVVGIRKEVSDYSIVKRIGSKVFYKIMTKFSDINIPPNSTDFRLIDKKVVETLNRFSERTRMFRGLIDWLGFKRDLIEFAAPSRHNGGIPSYSTKKLFNLAINSFTSFSLLPLRLTGYLGIAVICFSCFLLSVMMITDFLDLQVFTLLAYFMVLNTFLVGVLLSAMGMMALYIGHIHTEVVGRPLYVIRERVN